MNDRRDDYYQPWLRDPVPGPAKNDGSAPAEGLAKPPASPPIGIDVSAYPIEDAAVPPLARAPDRLKAGTRTAVSRMRDAAHSFADWTIKAGVAADIPAKVERLELPRRTRELAQGSAATTARAGKGIGKGAVTVWNSLAAATAKGWQRLALPDHVGNIADSAKSGIGAAAGKTRSGIGSAAKAGLAGVSEATSKATGKLRPAAKPVDAPLPSGLDQLIEREAAAAPVRKSAPDLPLFAAENGPSPQATPEKKPAPQAMAAAPPAAAIKAATPPVSPAPQRLERTGGGMAWPAALASPWWLAAGALALAAVFWLGARIGGDAGLSRDEVEAVVADYILANPEIIPEAMANYRANEMAKSIAAIRPALEKPYSGAWAGNAKGDVTITVFTDYGCVFCRASVPDVDRLLREDSGVKVVFRELPIIAPQSRDAAIMALRAARQGKYDAFHHAMFAAGSLETSAIAAAAAKAGLVTDGSADATASAAVLQRELDSNLAIAQQLQLNATPTWIIGDQLLQGALGYDALRAAVVKARTGARS